MLKRILQITICILGVIFIIQFFTTGVFRSITEHIKSAITTTEVALPADNSTDVLQESLPVVKSVVKRPLQGPTIESIVDATNKERIARGIPPLHTNPLLTASATVKTDDMIINHYFEHTSPTGITVGDLGAQAGYNYVTMGENLALGDFATAADLMDAWMKSPGHRENILNPLYQEVGVSIKKGVYQGSLVWFAVQHFGTSREACPAISRSLQQSIEKTKDDLSLKEKNIISLRSDIETSATVHDEDYKDLVDEFNAEVESYNTKLSRLKTRIDSYNQQVADFNNCLLVYQKK